MTETTTKAQFRDVSPSVSFPEMETQILDLWRERNVFQRSMSEREGGPEYVFYEGPPTANGRPGIHHVLSRSFKDIFPRYHTMQGCYVQRRGGWDTHGLPVEIEVEKRLGLSAASSRSRSSASPSSTSSAANRPWSTSASGKR